MSDSTNNFSLRFTLRPSRSRLIIQGLLELLDNDRTQINAYRASSSYAGKQYWASWREKGGLIPPNEPWLVHLQPLDRTYNPAIGPTAYKITPFMVDTTGDDRGDFMIHPDGNAATAPGTLGCIFPITDRGWNAIKRDFVDLRVRGIETLPLEVLYLR
jgi:hypothetical protein